MVFMEVGEVRINFEVFVSILRFVIFSFSFGVYLYFKEVIEVS